MSLAVSYQGHCDFIARTLSGTHKENHRQPLPRKGLPNIFLMPTFFAGDKYRFRMIIDELSMGIARTLAEHR
jgi:hypothetical protein